MNANTASKLAGYAKTGQDFFSARCLTLILAFLCFASQSFGQSTPAKSLDPAPGNKVSDLFLSPLKPAAGQSQNPLPAAAPVLPDLTKRENFSAALQMILLLTVLSLAPAIILMMTSFTRIVIVLSLVRQALGTQQLPPNQIIIGLAMFMTFLVMGKTFTAINDNGLQPYLKGDKTQRDFFNSAEAELRKFMIAQVVAAKNDEDVQMLHLFAGKTKAEQWSDVATTTLIPGFMLSELKTAFLLGFKIYLPFLIIDMVISSILISMGMMMLPPVMISLPFKLLLFVLVDGWALITQGLMLSFAT